MQPSHLNISYSRIIAISAYILAGTMFSCQPVSSGEESSDFDSARIVDQTPITVPQSPEQSLTSFRLPKGYHLELVASEPMIAEPVAIAWNGNGAMYVAQMETYMQTVDAKGQEEPLSSIKLLEDTNDDGRMDKSTVFIDSLVAPRMILCVGKELFVNETNSYDIHAYKDTNGDGQADEKRAVYENPKRAYGNIEHQRSGLDWNLDNWIYVTTDPVRFKYINGKLIADTLISGSNGQWGLTHDDFGRLFFSRAASGMAASGFQINPTYGQLDLEGSLDKEFQEVWPLIKTPDVNGGPRTLRPDSTMFGFTSVTGQSIFRGDKLPKEFMGNYLVADPVGRFIRRAYVYDDDGKISLKNAYNRDEFITSPDMNFRPVNTYTGPDGCWYIVDMYRGIIQESTWAQPGSFLYHQIMSKRLDQNIKRGRIYRLVYNGIQRGKKPDILSAAPTELVSYLGHPNGWWRDNAQKEIIIRADRSVVPLLKKIVSKRGDKVGRLHALWTLDGLAAVDKETLLSLLADENIQILKAAIRLSEPLLKQSDKEVLAALGRLRDHKSRDVRSQMLLSLSQSDLQSSRDLRQKIISENADDELLTAIRATLERRDEDRKYGYKLSSLDQAARRSIIEGAAIFKSLCASCHGPEGQGLRTKVAPPLISKFKLIEHRDEVIKIMLHGLEGPVDGQAYSERMIPMGNNTDEWIGSVLNYVRYDLCMRSFPRMNEGYLKWVIITPEQVKNIREKNSSRRVPWTWDELLVQKKQQ